MRVLIWTDAFWPEIGGMEIFCMNLATGFAKNWAGKPGFTPWNIFRSTGL
jgi:hypothetical protein